MHNQTTGEEVVCYTSYYRFEPGLPHLRIALQCIHACERHGFEHVGAETTRYGSAPAQTSRYEGEPILPDEDVKPYIPTACLP
jgi:hypothetical protein